MAVRLAFEEVPWWYFANASAMAYDDTYTGGRFQAAHEPALRLIFNDDPLVNGSVDPTLSRRPRRSRRTCVPVIKLRAYDHLCLFGRSVA